MFVHRRADFDTWRQFSQMDIFSLKFNFLKDAPMRSLNNTIKWYHRDKLGNNFIPEEEPQFWASSSKTELLCDLNAVMQAVNFCEKGILKNNSKISTIYQLVCSLWPYYGLQLFSASCDRLGYKTDRNVYRGWNNTFPKQ